MRGPGPDVQAPTPNEEHASGVHEYCIKNPTEHESTHEDELVAIQPQTLNPKSLNTPKPPNSKH